MLVFLNICIFPQYFAKALQHCYLVNNTSSTKFKMSLIAEDMTYHPDPHVRMGANGSTVMNGILTNVWLTVY